MAHPFPDGSAIALHRDVAATASSLGPAGPGWTAAMKQLLPVAKPLVEAVLAPFPPMRAPARLALALRSDGLEWARRMAGSIEALGLDVFEGDRRATAWLAGSAQHSGLPPTAAGSGAFGLLLQLLGHSHGWPLPRGGMRSAGRRAGPPRRARGRDDPLRRDGRRRARARRPRRRRAARGRRGDRRRRGRDARSARACWRGCCPPARCRAGCTGGCGSGATARRRSSSTTRSRARSPGRRPRRARQASCTSAARSRS